MPRPQISKETQRAVEDIHEGVVGSPSPDFETALATVLELASAKLEDDRGWHPGKYAKKTMEMVFDDSTERPVRPPRSPRMPDDYSEFKAILDDDGQVEIPLAERRALGLETDDLIEVTVRAFERESDE